MTRPFPADECASPPPAPTDPHPAGPARFLNRAVSFNSPEGKAPAGRLCGLVERAEFVGLIPRGNVPDYRLTIRGASGKTVIVSLVEHYVAFQDDC